MFHILGFLFILLLAVLFVGIGLISSFLRALFGWGRQRSGSAQQQSARTGATSSSSTSRSSRRRKIFTPDDGEYVDFEEIKEAEEPPSKSK
ncbi:MAG: DUF4834 family protein [Prevotellaceae bacterium]|jgi:hypothetical protein|nr:DUF4834 family protein [Prevotellaceae bacterium]